MVVDLSNAGPMVKLAVALLDDEMPSTGEPGYGITEDALSHLKNVASTAFVPSSDLDHIWKMVKGIDGRCYLRDGWNNQPAS